MGAGGISAMYQALLVAFEEVKASKPNDKSELDRRYAIAITMLEQVIAYVWLWIERR